MAFKTYYLTIDEAALTDELRQLLESKGASLHEEPIQQLDLPKEEAEEIIRILDEIDNGKRYKTWAQVKAEAKAYRAQRRKHA